MVAKSSMPVSRPCKHGENTKNTLSMKAEHEPDLYPASKASKASKSMLTLDIAKGRICSGTAVERGAQSSAVYRGLPLCISASLRLPAGSCIFLVLGSFVLSCV